MHLYVVHQANIPKKLYCDLKAKAAIVELIRSGRKPIIKDDGLKRYSEGHRVLGREG